MARFSKLWSVVIFALWLTLAAAAQQAAPAPALIPRALLFGNPEKVAPQLSPDASKLAYLAPDAKGVLNVWVRTVGKQDDRVVTADKKRGVRSFRWQFDNQHILYMQDQGGDENFHVYQTDPATGLTRDLTPIEGIRAEIIADSEQFPDQLLVMLNARDRRVFDVYRVNLKNGALDLDTENPGGATGWLADRQLQVRVAESHTPDGGMLIRVRDSVKAPWREFLRWGPDETGQGAAEFTPDGKALLVGTSLDANAARLLSIDLATGKRTVIAEDPMYDAGSIAVNRKTRQLAAVGFIRQRREWVVIDKALEPDFAALRKVRDADFTIGNELNDTKWVVTYVNDNGPVYYYLYDRTTRQATYLFNTQPKLEQYKLARMKPVSFKARDGMSIYGYLTAPEGISKPPLVLMVHGGPWSRDVWGFNPYAQWFANRGYATFQINYRGSTGYGKAYLNAGDREWAGKMHDDLLDGKKWVLEQGWADPSKVCIFGGSYGGYATLVALAFTPNEFLCGVDLVGPSNIVTLFKTIPPYWAPMVANFYKRVGNLEKEEEFLKSRSPLFKADQIKGALLIGQGANDPRVKQAESDQIVAAMRKNSKPVEYYVFPDEGHGFARPENRMAFNAVTERFLAKYLGGRVEPASEPEAKLLETVKK